LLTSGHCVANNFQCLDSKWIFDYRKDIINDDGTIFIDPKKVYGCKDVMAFSFKNDSNYFNDKLDYALIKLSRPVKDRKPLKYRRTEGRISGDAKLVLIGHPLGLPSIIADDAFIRDNSYKYFFSTNLDACGGNSGSPVFNQETGLVEGILTSGQYDYVYNFSKQCFNIAKCSDYGCRGDLVTRIEMIAELAKQYYWVAK